MENHNTTPADLFLLKEFFEKLPSPVAIIDCQEAPYAALNGPSFYYSNPKLDAWLNGTSLTSKDAFAMWATDPLFWNAVKCGKSEDVTHLHITWSTYFVGGRWGIMQSISTSDDRSLQDREESPRPRKRSRHGSNYVPSRSAAMLLTPDSEPQSFIASPPSSVSDGCFDEAITDWTRRDIPDAPPYIQFLRRFDWKNTHFGALETWSPTLRAHVNFVSAHPGVRCVYFGRENPTVFYNEESAHVIGTLHPHALGVVGSVAAGPTWQIKYRNIKEVWRTGRAVTGEPMYHPMPKNNLPLAETHYNWAMVPMFDEFGKVFGVMGEFEECSEEVMKRRALETVDMARHMGPVDSMDSFWNLSRAVVDHNDKDFAYAMFYSAPEESRAGNYGASTPAKMMPGPFKLESVIGLDESHCLAVKRLDLTNCKYELAKHFRTAWFSGEEVVLHAAGNEQRLPASLQMAIKGRGHEGTVHTAVICPIKMIGCPGSVGFVLLGLNSQRHFDNNFRSLVTIMINQFSQQAANIIIPEERQKYMRHQRRVQESIYAKVAELATVGIAIYEPASNVFTWTNKRFDELVDLRKHSEIPVHPDDQEHFDDYLRRLIQKPCEHCFQFRIHREPEEGEGSQDSWQWVVIKASSEKVDVSSKRSCSPGGMEGDCDMGTEVTNIDHITYFMTETTPEMVDAEVQSRQVKELIESKKQSENFIDMTCHELRNPLSAIIQSADGILTAFDHPADATIKIPEADTSGGSDTEASVLDAAQTILLCAQHQRRIVDDILTISKLDSERLLIAPERGRPISLVERALTMYEGELAEAGIESEFRVDHSYSELAIESVYLDTSRLLQVLINLLTNAIKFTRKSTTERTINITLGASESPPSTSSRNISFIPQRTTRNDACSGPEWGKGKEVYLQFDVIDSGKGLTAEEMNQLFLRFSQASAKTYSQYGGSGLGLFISRELTELHGGQIGVYSIAGRGATFSFYIKARKYMPEASDISMLEDALPSEAVPGAQKVKHSASASLAYSEAATLNSQLSPSELHILLVEDNLINQRVTAKALRKLGCTVHVANHGVECLKVLESTELYRNPPGTTDATSYRDRIPLSVILLDQEMPVMNGLTCVKRIREMQKLGDLMGHVPVIGCTGNARREQVAECLSAGMDEVVTKPFRIDELMDKILRVVGNNKVGVRRDSRKESV